MKATGGNGRRLGISDCKFLKRYGRPTGDGCLLKRTPRFRRSVVPVFVVMMVVLFAALGISVLVFGIPVRGSLLLFAVAGAFAALAGIGIGVMVATVAKSQRKAQLLTFFVNPLITLLSEATSPLDNMPAFFQKLSYINPLRYMVTIVRGVTLKNAPWSAFCTNLVALIVFSAILFSISAWRFRKV